MQEHQASRTPTSAGAGPRTGGRTRARWRIAERVVSIGIGGAALSGAVYLGLTGPLISPVSAAAGTAATATADGVAAADAADDATGRLGQDVVPDDGTRDRDGRAGRDGDGSGPGRRR